MTSAEPHTQSPTVAIIGGGASGTLTAIDLLRRGASVVLFEPRGVAGQGVAYSTTDPRHLLNVRAGAMSALADEPADLCAWIREQGLDVPPTGFLPRRDFGRYLRDRLERTAEQASGSFELVAEQVTDVEPSGSGFTVTAGGAYAVDAAVLAYGNPPPQPLPDLPEASWHLAEPWDVARIGALPDDAEVLVVGTALTAVDTAITLLGDSGKRRVVMVSRHGLVPNPHVDAELQPWETTLPEGPLTADGMVELVRAQIEAAAAEGVDWRAVIDGLRPVTQPVWRRLPEAERRRFRETYAREWEIRRHRMAPRIGALLDGYRDEGRLEVLSGGVKAIDATGDRPVVTLADGERPVSAVVNCTGPSPDIDRSDNPLLVSLRGRGLVSADPLRLGIRSTEDGQVVDAGGEIVPGLLAVGPPCRGALYESTAIPEIRAQAVEVAARLAGAAG